MVRKSKEAGPLYVGFFGTGKVSDKETDALLTEYLTDKGDEITFLIPATKPSYTDTMAAVVAFAQACDPPIPYEIIHDQVSAKARPIAAAIKGASKTHQVAGVGRKLVADLAKKDDALLVVIWDDDDTELEKVVNAARDADMMIRDLTVQLTEVEFTDEEDETAPDEADTDTEAAPEAAEDSDPVDDTPYTAEELEGAELPDLKQVAADMGIEVPPRSRKPTYVALILDAQEKAAAAPEGVRVVSEGGSRVPAGITIQPVDPEEIATAVVEALCGDGGPLANLGDILDSIEEGVAAIATSQANLVEAVTEALRTPAPAKADPEPDEQPAPAKRPLRRRL